MPEWGCQLIAEWLLSGEIWQPAGVVGEFLVEKILKIVGFDEVLDVGIFFWGDEAVFEVGKGLAAGGELFGALVEINRCVLVHQRDDGAAVGVVFEPRENVGSFGEVARHKEMADDYSGKQLVAWLTRFGPFGGLRVGRLGDFDNFKRIIFNYPFDRGGCYLGIVRGGEQLL